MNYLSNENIDNKAIFVKKYFKLSIIISTAVFLIGYVFLLWYSFGFQHDNLPFSVLDIFYLNVLWIYTPITLLVVPGFLMMLVNIKITSFKKYLIAIVTIINLIILFLFKYLYDIINPSNESYVYFDTSPYIEVNYYIALVIAPLLSLIIMFIKAKHGTKMRKAINLKDSLIGVYSIIVGIISGLSVCVIFGMILVTIIFEMIPGYDISGEGSLAIAVYGVLLGAPIGVIGGSLLSYSKRKNKWWLLSFSVITFVVLLLYLSPILVSPVGEVVRLFN